MRLLLIRHGQTDHNRDSLTLGRADVPLNDRGRLQARAVAASFLRPPDAIYTSPLARCRETADAIAGQTGAKITVDERLIEMDVGEMEHLTRDELRARYPEFLRAWLSPEVADARMPGGESLREVQDRAWPAVEAAIGAHRDGTIVLVSHTFVIRAILCRAMGLPLAEFRRLKQSLAAISAVDFARGEATVARLNDISHLIRAGLADDS
jgi:broad specificity phosphatase PhoE